jgi:hypothetical protein
MKPLAIALSGAGGDDLTNLHCKVIRNWHNESLLYSEYMVRKMKPKQIIPEKW